MNSISASLLVNVVPSVLGAGGNPLSLNSVFLTDNPAIPIDPTTGYKVMAFPTLDAVEAFFGNGSNEANAAAVYFNGFNGATTLPGLLYFVQFNLDPVRAYLRGGSVAGLTLAQLQALSGNLTLTVNGVASTSAPINLAAATSFSNAAALIQTGIQAGTPSSTATCVYDAQRQAFVINSPTTGDASTISFATGTLSAGLKLTQALGAVISTGADAPEVGDVLDDVVAQTQNWALFMSLDEQDDTANVEFAQWANDSGQRYAFVGWDQNEAATQGAAPSSFPMLTADYNGRIAMWGPMEKAAFICGITAAINFNETNGRITYAFKAQAGLVADVTDAAAYTNLLANGYNCYADFATANDQFQFLQNGQISGAWKWIDAYVNQIKLNSDLQLALVTMMAAAKSLPYVTRGYDMIRAAILGPVTTHLRFGSIVAGVTLSALQRQQVNTAAGTNIADTLSTRGWYLQVLDADPVVRANRGSPPCTFWYTDGGSIQKINLASIDVQ